MIQLRNGKTTNESMCVYTTGRAPKNIGIPGSRYSPDTHSPDVTHAFQSRWCAIASDTVIHCR